MLISLSGVVRVFKIPEKNVYIKMSLVRLISIHIKAYISIHYERSLLFKALSLRLR